MMRMMKASLLSYLTLCMFCVTLVSSTFPKYYEAIYNFGDSLSDTGNLLLEGASRYPMIGDFPYGETYFHRPTGRFCDGRLMIDFIADALGLPFIPPYEKVRGGTPSTNGVNFAVGGATALDANLYQDIPFLLTNNSLDVQLGWFKEYKSSLCNTKQECERYFKKSVFFMGEIGGNDFNYPFFLGATIEQLTPIVPLVVQAIVNATTILIEDGATNIMIPGNLPIGCTAVYLTIFQSPNVTDYDTQTGCLKAYNAFSKYYNENLIQALQMLRQKYPRTRIIYADYYGAAMQFYRKPVKYGFTDGALRACCGGNGPYNFDFSTLCGMPGYNLCPDPSTFANWDGIHWTEAAYKIIANSLLFGGYTSPPLIRFHP